MPANDSTHVAESLLENESLTSNLDDTAANVLLDWGIACAKLLAEEYSELATSDMEAAIYQQLRATRRLMRLVNRWVPQRLELDRADNAGLFSRIIEQAAIIYGEDYIPPIAEQKEAFLTQSLSKTASQFIANLRQLVEDHDCNMTTNLEETDG